MDDHSREGRSFLKALTAISAVGLPIVSSFGSGLSPDADSSAMTSYDPKANVEITVSEVEMRRNSAGRMLMARIYQPKGAGLFPACWICMVAPGMLKIATRKSQWTAP